MNAEIDRLFKVAKKVILNSYSPYSNYSVSASILANNGKVYYGVNIENASYPCSLCAEGAAIANMVTDIGKESRILKVLVMADYNSANDVCPPCGLCRQMISEFASKEVPIYLCNTQEVIEIVNLGQILYMSFGANNLLDKKI